MTKWDLWAGDQPRLHCKIPSQKQTNLLKIHQKSILYFQSILVVVIIILFKVNYKVALCIRCRRVLLCVWQNRDCSRHSGEKGNMSCDSKWLGVESQLEMSEQCVGKHDGVLRPSHPAVFIMVGSHIHTCPLHTSPDTLFYQIQTIYFPTLQIKQLELLRQKILPSYWGTHPQNLFH